MAVKLEQITAWRLVMAKLKFDGLIEAVRYAPDGKIILVRAYERRGATFRIIY